MDIFLLKFVKLLKMIVRLFRKWTFLVVIGYCADFYDVKEAHDMFPDFLDHRQRTESESTFSVPSERSVSPDLSSSLTSMSLENTCAGPSFATMLASEKKRFWPSLKRATNQPSSTPVKLINVTGSNMLNVNIRNRRDSDPDVGNSEPIPDFNRSFGDALAEALIKGLNENGDSEINDPDGSGKKKKKRNKQKLLFSTHMTFSGN